MENKPVVTITGVSGYLGSHVCLYFLKSGEFKVRGTVRSKTNAKKIEPLRKAFGEYFNQLELVEADLYDKNSVINALEGSEFVVHTASPIPTSLPKNEQELLVPAIEGTKAVLEACRRNKTKRCVVTSSTTTVMQPAEPRQIYDETCWTETSKTNAYVKSKTLAEQEAWKFVQNLPATEKFELTTVLPGVIIGPTMLEVDFSTGSLIKGLMLKKLPALPKIQADSIDVRDLAKAHFKALTVPEAAGQRIIVTSGGFWMKELAALLHKHYGKDYPVTQRMIPKCVIWLGSFFSGHAKIMLETWGKEQRMDNTRCREILGITNFIGLEQSMTEMVESMIKQGQLPRYKNKKAM